MCGRFNIIDDKGMRDLLAALGFEFNFPTRVNIAPTESVPVILRADDQLQVRDMRWWLTPSWAPEVSTRFSMFNARCENIETSKAFRGPFRHKRGVVPASSFIEWRSEPGGKQAYLVRPAEGAFLLAAIWDHWQRGDSELESCALITTDAAEAINWLHHRMPVMLSVTDIQEWLDPGASAAQLRELMSRELTLQLEAVPISSEVNSGRNKHPQVLREMGHTIAIR